MPKDIDLGVVPIFQPIHHTLELFNPSLDEISYQLAFKLDDEEYILDSNTTMTHDEEHKIQNDVRLCARAFEGTIPPRSIFTLQIATFLLIEIENLSIVHCG